MKFTPKLLTTITFRDLTPTKTLDGSFPQEWQFSKTWNSCKKESIVPRLMMLLHSRNFKHSSLLFLELRLKLMSHSPLFNKVTLIMLSQEMLPTSKIYLISKTNKRNAVAHGPLLDQLKIAFPKPYHPNSLRSTIASTPLSKPSWITHQPAKRELKSSPTSLEFNKIPPTSSRVNFCNIFHSKSLSRKTERDTNRSNSKDFWTALKFIALSHRNRPWINSAPSTAKLLKLWLINLITTSAPRFKLTMMISVTKPLDHWTPRSSTISSALTEQEETSPNGCFQQLDIQMKKSEELTWDSLLEKDSL